MYRLSRVFRPGIRCARYAGWCAIIGRAEPELCPALRERGATVGATGAVAERPVDPGAVWHPLGAATDGATELQPAVSLVRRPVAGRFGVGSNDVHQEPRTPADRRGV